MILSIIMTITTTALVQAAPMDKETRLNSLINTLYNGPKATDRVKRETNDDLDMCSYRMQNITRLADVAGAVFVSNINNC